MSYEIFVYSSYDPYFLQGRNGKGSIYVWANGNGGPNDDCGADGFASSIYTISVGAMGLDGDPSPFDEACSAKMVTAYVTDTNKEQTIVSVTFLHKHTPMPLI